MAGQADDGDAINPAGRKVELFDDAVFAELRSKDDVPAAFINAGWDFDSDFKAGGGKGGTLMAMVGDSYIVKELSKGDHIALSKIARSYVRHVCDGETLLCPIYVHFVDVATGRFFLAMRNCIGTGENIVLYDLKGCADDKTLEKDGKKIPAVHKRIWNVGMWLGTSGWSPERHAYYRGKKDASTAEIQLEATQRDQVLSCICRDTQWLSQESLMDYSLLVAVREVSKQQSFPSKSATGASMAATPFVYSDESGRMLEVHISIIDFLQLWTSGKKVAMCIKVMERNKATVPPKQYGERFYAYASERFKATSNLVAC
mmetsp:Transcript_52426/g.125257  ORF Transcript_52426/g.125257 Transcript_52426/m.125257 type:complete len:316 (+) Transcript_52426:86-1033(+)